MQILSQTQHFTSSFFAWWFGELAAFVPGLRWSLLNQSESNLLVGMSGGGVALSLSHGKDKHFLGQIDETAGKAAFTAALLTAPKRVDLKNSRVTLRLSGKDVLRKALTLPLAAEENLREILSFELDELSPFSRQDAYFDFHIAERDKATQRLKIDLFIVPHRVVDSALSKLSSWGLLPDVIDVASDDIALPATTNFLPQELRPTQSRFGRLLAVGLTATALGLSAIAVFLPLDRKMQTADTLAVMVQDLRQEARAAHQIRQEIDQISQEQLFISDLKWKNPFASVVLNEISRMLPDDTWLIRLRLSGDDVELSGYSPRSSDLIGVFEESTAFSSARFRAPVTQEQRLNLERFSLSVQVAGNGGEQ